MKKNIVLFGIVLLFLGLAFTPTINSYSIQKKVSSENIDVYESYKISSNENEWRLVFGEGGDQSANSVQQTRDGDYVLVGYSRVNNKKYGLLAKISSDGDVDRVRVYDGLDSWVAKSVLLAEDHGYIILGSEPSFGNVFFIKTDENGNIERTKTIRGKYKLSSNSIKKTFDGGYIICATKQFEISGETLNEVCLIKTNNKGTREWEKTYDMRGEAQGKSVVQTIDGGYAILGNRWQNIWLIKTDEYGSIEWDAIITYGEGARGNDLKQTQDGGFIITGFVKDGYYTGDVLLIKVNKAGKVEWKNKFGGKNKNQGHSIQLTEDGGYIIAGTKFTHACPIEPWSFVPFFDAWLIKTYKNGTVEWEKRIYQYMTTVFLGIKKIKVDTPFNSQDFGYSVMQTSDKGYILAGKTNFYEQNSDILVVKTDEMGNSNEPKNAKNKIFFNFFEFLKFFYRGGI
jgi:hypothetical protein